VVLALLRYLEAQEVPEFLVSLDFLALQQALLSLADLESQVFLAVLEDQEDQR
jgi:hypothetical protein